MALPWEVDAGLLPWEADDYPRTVSFYREAPQTGGFLGHDRTKETLLFANIPASLQSPSMGMRRIGDGRLPDDSPGPIIWDIFVSSASIAKGSIISRDIVVDDEGNRYQVGSAYWTPIGWRIQTIRLEA